VLRPTIATRLRAALDALDDRLSRLGPWWSTAALTAMATVAAVTLHYLVRWAEGLPVQPYAMINLAVEITVIAGPIIFYARDVIAQLETSRAIMDGISRMTDRASQRARDHPRPHPRIGGEHEGRFLVVNRAAQRVDKR